MAKAHSFHIPVMGLSFTIDTPLKVAQYGIDSVISLNDDILLERLRKMYCSLHNFPYEEITSKMEDFRAKRITSYLNLINDLASKQLEEFKQMALKKKDLVKEYLAMLPDQASIQEEFKNLMDKLPGTEEIRSWLDETFSLGSIDVNIMTKVDNATYVKSEKQPIQFNTAHSALRGYAQSDLTSSIVFSAGMNPRLYSYMEEMEDFFPDEDGNLKKKIILKVSDYRSAFIQGKFLAKKGLWVSEYRIESGLNCGGHAFATDGYLLGPILAEFKDKRQELFEITHEIFTAALARKDYPQPKKILPIKITAQGGVGLAEEHQFLLDHYEIDSVGWGSPFLLVPEATTVDDHTLNQIAAAKEEDLYLSNVSPLGVPFNNLRNSSKGVEKLNLVNQGNPGSSCPKKFLALDREYSEKGVCTASKKYQLLKIKELEAEGLSPEAYQKQYDDIVAKECLCTGLGSSALMINDLDTKVEGDAVSICPGPNIAYFSKIMSLKEITGHIYGRANMMTHPDRPNMFMKELKLYIDYLRDKIDEFKSTPSAKSQQYLDKFITNLNGGINYYKNLFGDLNDKFQALKTTVSKDLKDSQNKLQQLKQEIENILSLESK